MLSHQGMATYSSSFDTNPTTILNNNNNNNQQNNIPTNVSHHSNNNSATPESLRALNANLSSRLYFGQERVLVVHLSADPPPPSSSSTSTTSYYHPNHPRNSNLHNNNNNNADHATTPTTSGGVSQVDYVMQQIRFMLPALCNFLYLSHARSEYGIIYIGKKTVSVNNNNSNDSQQQQQYHKRVGAFNNANVALEMKQRLVRYFQYEVWPPLSCDILDVVAAAPSSPPSSSSASTTHHQQQKGNDDKNNKEAEIEREDSFQSSNMVNNNNNNNTSLENQHNTKSFYVSSSLHHSTASGRRHISRLKWNALIAEKIVPLAQNNQTSENVGDGDDKNSNQHTTVNNSNKGNDGRYFKITLQNINRLHFDTTKLDSAHDKARWEERRLYIRVLDSLNSKIGSYEEYERAFREACLYMLAQKHSSLFIDTPMTGHPNNGNNNNNNNNNNFINNGGQNHQQGNFPNVFMMNSSGSSSTSTMTTTRYMRGSSVSNDPKLKFLLYGENNNNNNNGNNNNYDDDDQQQQLELWDLDGVDWEEYPVSYKKATTQMLPEVKKIPSRLTMTRRMTDAQPRVVVVKRTHDENDDDGDQEQEQQEEEEEIIIEDKNHPSYMELVDEEEEEEEISNNNTRRGKSLIEDNNNVICNFATDCYLDYATALMQPESSTLDYKSYMSNTVESILERTITFMTGFLNAHGFGRLAVGVLEVLASAPTSGADVATVEFNGKPLVDQLAYGVDLNENDLKILGSTISNQCLRCVPPIPPSIVHINAIPVKMPRVVSSLSPMMTEMESMRRLLEQEQEEKEKETNDKKKKEDIVQPIVVMYDMTHSWKDNFRAKHNTLMRVLKKFDLNLVHLPDFPVPLDYTTNHNNNNNSSSSEAIDQPSNSSFDLSNASSSNKKSATRKTSPNLQAVFPSTPASTTTKRTNDDENDNDDDNDQTVQNDNDSTSTSTPSAFNNNRNSASKNSFYSYNNNSSSSFSPLQNLIDPIPSSAVAFVFKIVPLNEDGKKLLLEFDEKYAGALEIQRKGMASSTTRTTSSANNDENPKKLETLVILDDPVELARQDRRTRAKNISAVEYNIKNSWKPYDQQYTDLVVNAWIEGKASFDYFVHNTTYLVDLVRFTQTNTKTGTKRAIRFVFRRPFSFSEGTTALVASLMSNNKNKNKKEGGSKKNTNEEKSSSAAASSTSTSTTTSPKFITPEMARAQIAQTIPPWITETLDELDRITKGNKQHSIVAAAGIPLPQLYLVDISIDIARLPASHPLRETYTNGKFFSDWPTIPLWDPITQSVGRVERDYTLPLVEERKKVLNKQTEQMMMRMRRMKKKQQQQQQQQQNDRKIAKDKIDCDDENENNDDDAIEDEEEEKSIFQTSKLGELCLKNVAKRWRRMMGGKATSTTTTTATPSSSSKSNTANKRKPTTSLSSSANTFTLQNTSTATSPGSSNKKQSVTFVSSKNQKQQQKSPHSSASAASSSHFYHADEAASILFEIDGVTRRILKCLDSDDRRSARLVSQSFNDAYCVAKGRDIISMLLNRPQFAPFYANQRSLMPPTSMQHTVSIIQRHLYRIRQHTRNQLRVKQLEQEAREQQRREQEAFMLKEEDVSTTTSPPPFTRTTSTSSSHPNKVSSPTTTLLSMQTLLRNARVPSLLPLQVCWLFEKGGALPAPYPFIPVPLSMHHSTMRSVRPAPHLVPLYFFQEPVDYFTQQQQQQQQNHHHCRHSSSASDNNNQYNPLSSTNDAGSEMLRRSSFQNATATTTPPPPPAASTSQHPQQRHYQSQFQQHFSFGGGHYRVAVVLDTSDGYIKVVCNNNNNNNNNGDFVLRTVTGARLLRSSAHDARSSIFGVSFSTISADTLEMYVVANQQIQNHLRYLNHQKRTSTYNSSNNNTNKNNYSTSGAPSTPPPPSQLQPQGLASSSSTSTPATLSRIATAKSSPAGRYNQQRDEEREGNSNIFASGFDTPPSSLGGAGGAGGGRTLAEAAASFFANSNNNNNNNSSNNQQHQHFADPHHHQLGTMNNTQQQQQQLPSLKPNTSAISLNDDSVIFSSSNTTNATALLYQQQQQQQQQQQVFSTASTQQAIQTANSLPRPWKLKSLLIWLQVASSDPLVRFCDAAILPTTTTATTTGTSSSSTNNSTSHHNNSNNRNRKAIPELFGHGSTFAFVCEKDCVCAIHDKNHHELNQHEGNSNSNNNNNNNNNNTNNNNHFPYYNAASSSSTYNSFEAMSPCTVTNVSGVATFDCQLHRAELDWASFV